MQIDDSSADADKQAMRQCAESATGHSEELCRELLKLAALGIEKVALSDGRFLEVNPELSDILGYSPADLVGRCFREITHPEDLLHEEALLRKLLDRELPSYTIEKRYRHKNGSDVWVRVKSSIAMGQDAEPYRISVVDDVSEAKQIEEALAASEERYRLAIASFHGATYDTDLESGYAYRAPRFYEMLGVRPEEGEPTRDWWFSHIHPEDAPRFHAALDALFSGTAGELDLEFRVRHEMGGWIWVWQRGLAVRDATGRVRRTVGVILDITQRKRAEEALRTSELLKSAILGSVRDAIVTIDDDSRVIEWNPAAERIFGHSREEALGLDIAELIIPAEYRQRHHEGMARYLATGHGPVLGRRIELEALRADGSRFPVELAINPTSIEGRPHFTAHVRDITQRKQAEADLRESEQRLRATYEHAFAGIAEVGRDGRFLRVNEQFSRITGYSREELLERTFVDITHPDERGLDLDQFREQMAGDLETYTLEKRFIHKDGHVVWVELSASRVDDAAGRPLYGIRVVRDMTERRRAEEHRNLLINELNHRVKNTLATVQAIVSQTLRSTQPEHARAAIEARLAALARAHDVLTRESWTGAGLRDIVLQTIEPYRGEHESRFEVDGPQVRLSPRISLVIAMALQELATNAAKYGALSNVAGQVRIVWRLDGTRLRLCWEEQGGPPVTEPVRRGFGSRLIERGLAQEFGGEARITFDPQGVVCTVDILIE